MSTRRHADDLRAAGKLAVDATKRVTALVQAMHKEIASGPSLLGKPLAPFAELFTTIMYGSVKVTTEVVGVAVDRLLEELGPILGESTPGSEREAVRAALNAVVGDYLHAVNNPLAIEMRLHVVKPAPQMLVMVHGSGMSDQQWRSQGHDHGAMLADALGCGLAVLHYNSGLHISLNGSLFAAQLNKLAAETLHIVAYSMGGLVTRAAIANEKRLRTLITMGTPHHGAPLERGGTVVHALLGVSRYSAPIATLARIRSAGITDLRFGNVREEDWRDRDRFELGTDQRKPMPLPEGVDCYALAGTRSEAVDAKKLRSDGLVPVASALGEHERPEMTLAFKDKAVVPNTSHLGLLHSLPTYEQLKTWLTPALHHA
jgi:pimeloyl-ACP methyl ester carboxylesterase